MNANWCKNEQEFNGKIVDDGLGLCGILTIIFVLCKIFGIITWSWWWVFAPIWIPFLLGVLFIIFMVVVLLVYEVKMGEDYDE